MEKTLSIDFYNNANQLIKNYPKKVHSLLPILHMVQEELGYISISTMKEIAIYMQLPFNHILGVVTFYSMFSSNKRGKNYIGVCTNLSCWLKGSENLYIEIKKALIGKRLDFHIEKVECLGACGGAPVVLINKKYHENVDIIYFNQWLKELSIENKKC